MIDPAHKHIQVTFADGRSKSVPVGTAVGETLKAKTGPDGLHVLAALINNDVASLSYALEVDSRVEPITLADRHGRKVYRRSVSFLLAKAVKELFQDADLYVEHALGPGFYCTLEIDGEPVSDPQLDLIREKMLALVEEDLPIYRKKLAFEDALINLRDEDQMDKHGLLHYQNPPKVVVYQCEGFTDLAHGPLAGNTGALGLFTLIPYPPGFVLQFPNHDRPTEFDVFHPQPKLFDIFKEHKAWGRTVGVWTVSQLNELVVSGRAKDFVHIAEARHEKQIALLADHVHRKREEIHYVLIAGPSSAGKTTFSKRFGVQLRVNGLQPITLAIDNYFVEREDTPLDEEGTYDYEHVEAIDLNLLNEHLQALEAGKPVVVPRFDFLHGRKVFDEANTLQLAPGQIILMEGIHCLNPRLTEALDDSHKFRIYLSALTQLNLDRNNRISTTDNRLIRRMLRDHQFRGHSALDTFRMWNSVRRGEDRWIFPFQEQADAAFNSALDYELAVLRPRVEPLLAEVKPRHPEYAEARRLQDFMASIVGLTDEWVPENSLLREFLGKSSFTY